MSMPISHALVDKIQIDATGQYCARKRNWFVCLGGSVNEISHAMAEIIGRKRAAWMRVKIK